jgi:hypothetical protein
VTNSKTDEMRNIFIYTTDGISAVDALRNVKGWNFEDLGIPGGHKHCLSNGETKIAISEKTINIVMTSNVLPHDLDEDQGKANDALIALKAALDESDIHSVITASKNDLNKK